MTRVEKYDQVQMLIAAKQRGIAELRREIKQLEYDIEKEFGIEDHNREPGFACFSHKSLKGFYNTPRDVLKELDKESLFNL